jgi:hypothetical protein
MAAKQAPSKAEKTPKHRRKNHLATKAQSKKPPEHSLPTQCNH